MDDREGQLMDIVNCDRATAKRLLQDNNNDVETAIGAYFSGESAPVDAGSQAVVPFQPAEPSRGSGWTPPDTPIGPRPQGPLTQDNWAHLEGSINEVAKTAERTSKKRNTPVDLTGDDEDDDLRKAMQASLESESTRQKRQQEYGYDPRSGGRAVSGLVKDSECCIEGQRGVRSKGSKMVNKDPASDADDGEWMAEPARRPKATYKRCRRGKGARKGCTPAREVVQSDAMETDVPSEAEAATICSSAVNHEAKSSNRYGLRNRGKIRKPPNLLLESLASSVNTCANRKRRSTPRSKKNEVKEEAWWEKANSTVIVVAALALLCCNHRCDSTNDDDLALTRAIEASMQQSTTATRAQTPQPFAQDLDTLGAIRMRPPECPVVIMPPTPFMRLFATSLQALYAAKPFRKALMTLNLSDLRLTLNNSISSMENYWQGNSPSGLKGLSELDWASLKITASEEEKEALDATMRLLTLFIFLTYTKRPVCVAEDVISRPLKGNYAYVMNSARKPASDIVSCNIQNTLEAIMLALDSLNKQTEGSRENCKNELRSACMSFTASAVTPQSEETKQMRKPKEPYETSVYQLVHNNVNTSVHKALYACLADDKSLFTSTASTLFLSVSRLGALPFAFAMDTAVIEEVAPFQVESRIYLDQFMFDKRNGVRLGLDSDSVKNRLSKIEKLEKHRKAIGSHQGSESRGLIRASIKYFQELCSEKGADAIRMESVKEAVPRLEKMLAYLESQIADTDQQISVEKKAVEDERKAIMSGFLDGLSDPQLQTIRYDLQAVMMNDDQTAWTYVRHDEINRDPSNTSLPAWWKICDGQLQQVTEEDVIGDTSVVHFLIYTRHEDDEEKPEEDVVRDATMQESASLEQEGTTKPSKTIRLDSVLDWWTKTPLVECIEVDNAALGNALARQIRDSHEQEQRQSYGHNDQENHYPEATMSEDTVVPQFESFS